MARHLFGVAIVFAAILAMSCSSVRTPGEAAASDDRKDHHTLSNPDQIQVKNIELDLTVDFDRHTFSGAATLTVDRALNYRSGPIVLDTRSLDIQRAECSVDQVTWTDCKWELGKADPILGSPLTVHLADNSKFTRITYSTRPEASGLQWLTPAQTAGKKFPYVYSQSEAIHARSWVPCQDTPGVRMTYSARIRTPKPLLAVMSAENDSTAPHEGDYRVRMPQPIPSYLMAIAVGDIAFRSMSKRTGVYAEPGVVDRAAREFDDTESMMQAAEQLYGPYRWGRYDILVLPPSFPFGGMENPRLTFATPTLLAGDKSLVDTIAHELAHSWSGNLVTNATWRDFWLNEGFTTYVTLRIQEKVFGPDRADMEAALEYQELQGELKRLPPADQILHIDLKGRDPDDGMTEVPYDKGMLFLRLLELSYGRDRFDPFLRSWFDAYAFRSATTADFVHYLKTNLLNRDADIAKTINIDEWLYKPGLPSNAPKPSARAFKKIDEISKAWLSGKMATANLPVRSWSTQETLYFLRSLPDRIDRARMAELDREFHFTESGNAEIESQWLLMSIRNNYEPAYPRLQQFLSSVGRRKYLRPLYEELAKTPQGRERAQAIYSKARAAYHPIAQNTVDQILKAPAQKQ